MSKNSPLGDAKGGRKQRVRCSNMPVTMMLHARRRPHPARALQLSNLGRANSERLSASEAPRRSRLSTDHAGLGKGGAIRSDGGAMLLRQLDRRTGLSKAMARALCDPRDKGPHHLNASRRSASSDRRGSRRWSYPSPERCCSSSQPPSGFSGYGRPRTWLFRRWPWSWD